MGPMHIGRLAWRSLFRNLRRTLITLSSIGFGLAITLFLVSMGAGVHRKALEDGVRTLPGHLLLEHPAYADAPSPENALAEVASLRQLASGLPGVGGTTAAVLAQAVAATGSGSWAVMVSGVEPEIEAARSPLPGKMIEGHYLTAHDERGAVLGARLAQRLKASPGKKLVLTSANAHGELSSELVRVTGVFETGTDEADGFLVQVHIGAARRLLGLGADAASRVGVVLTSPDDQAQVRAGLEQALLGKKVVVLPWQEVMPELSGWMEVDRRFSRVVNFILLFLVAFTILNTILMSVVERRREFAVLLALGTPPGVLRAQIFAEATLLGGIGCAFGIAVGGSVSYYFQLHGFDLSALINDAAYVGGVMLDRQVHNDLRPLQVVVLGGGVFLATLIISIYPLLKSTQVDLAKLLRTR